MRVSELFTSLQGEGHWVGTPAAFIRLAGCNRACPFCDTDFSARSELSEQQLADWAGGTGMGHAVVTGGEPALQLTPSLVARLHERGLRVQVETNGTIDLPRAWGIDWVTCSPKTPTPRLRHIDELKVVFASPDDMAPWEQSTITHRFVQPCDTGDPATNERILRNAIDYCLKHPQWRLSLQTHKLIGIR